MVKEMAERKWMDSVLLPRRQREDFNDEYDSISRKVAKEWLLENGYEVYDFIWNILSPLTSEEFLIKLFGDKLEDLVKYEKAIRKLSKDAKVGLIRNYVYFGIGSDFVVKKNQAVYFVAAIVNQAEPKKFIKDSYRIAKEHGFKTMVLKLDVGIKVGEINLIET